MMYRNRRLLDSAKDKACTNCGNRDRTVVAAHSNDQTHGKGVGLKSHDIFHARLCGACHDFVDGRAPGEPTGRYQATKADRRECWARAHAVTLLALAFEGWIK